MTPLTTAPQQAIVVVGLGYGDESKGATVDFLASAIDDTFAVVRWSGGAQAAHNVRHGPRHHTFRQFGSATFLGVQTILRAPMLVNPLLLSAEAAELETKGVIDPLGLITADAACLVTTPIHAAMNRAREILRGTARHGSTGLGIGETVAYDLAIRQRARQGELIGNFPCPADAPAVPALRLGDLADRTTTTAALNTLATYARPLLDLVDDTDARHPSIAQMAGELMAVAREIRIVDDIGTTLSENLDAGTVIFEGSQGLMLDEWHGFHPHTTWATVTPRPLFAELTAAGHRPYVLGLTRTYATRHGHGPMPTEDATLELPEPDNGPGLYQGSWRIGHLDLPALRYAAKIAGRIDGIAVSHLDALSHGELRVAHTWDGDPDPLPLPTGQDLNQLDTLTATASSARPDLAPLPHDEHDVLALISEVVGAPVVLTADGPSRLHRRLTTGNASRLVRPCQRAFSA